MTIAPSAPLAPDRFGAALDALSEGVLVFGRDQRVVYANASAGRLLDKPADALPGMSLSKWRAVDLAGHVIPDNERPAARVFATGTAVVDLIVGTTSAAAGGRWLRVNARPLWRDGVVEHVLVSFTDVTDARKVSDAMQASEQINRQLMDALADGVFVAQDFQFVFCNPALAAMLGYAGDSFSGTPFTRVIAPDHQGTWLARYVQRIGSGPEPVRGYETVFLKADGSSRVELDLVATRITYNGRPAVLGVAREIAERNRNAAELEQHRHRLEELVSERTAELRHALDAHVESAHFMQIVTDNMPALVTYVDADRRLRFSNQGWLEFFDLDRDDAIGQPIDVLTGPEYMALARPAIELALGGEAVHTTEELTDFHGQSHCFRISRLPDQRGGAVRGYHLLATDITELRRGEYGLKMANAALADAEQFTRSIADNLPVRVAYWDRQLRCRFTNRAYRDWYGKTTDEMVGLDYETIFGRPSPPARLRNMDLALSGQPVDVEREEFDAAGVAARSHIHLIPDGQGANVRGVFVLAIDITVRQRTQAALQLLNDELVVARDRAESSVKAKAAFLANMSHEIRTPMNAIIGLTHLLRRDVHESKSSARLHRIADAAQHLLVILNDILDLSKIEAGKVDIDDVVFEMQPMLERCFALVAEQAKARKLALEMHCDGLPRRVRGDPTRVTQAIVNLLGNAVKFTEHGSVRLVGHVDHRDDLGAQVRFEVHDTGIGIEPQHLPRLFSAFEQADASTTRRFGGTGLGLALTRHLARLMGGDAGASSEPGRGSVFWISVRFGSAAQGAAGGALQAAPFGPLPATSAEPAADRPHPPQAAPPPDAERELRDRHAGALVLLAEDNFVNQEVALALLGSAGLTVEVASDGRQAIDMCAAARYDLVLMDIQMPNVDGFEASRAIRLDPRNAGLPIIAMTANAPQDQRTAALEAGMNDFIAKPVLPAVLYTVVRSWLDRAAEAGRGAADGHLESGRRDAAAVIAEATAAAPAAPAAPAELRSFAGIAGLDLQRGLQFFAGRPAAYRKALGLFVQLYRNGLAAADAGAADALGRELHGVGSACSSIGAAALAAEAAELTARLRRGEGALDAAPAATESAARAFSHRLVDFCAAVQAGAAERAAAPLEAQ